MTGQPLRASPRSLAGFGVVLALVAAAGLATALSTTGGAKNHPAPAHAAGGSAATSALAAPKPVPAADLVVQQQHAGTVAWNRALLVTARHGTMRSIKVSDDAGHAVAGAVSTTATTWVSAATLVPSTTYTVQSVLSQPDGQVVQRSVHVTASPAAALLTVGVTPAAGATVGIGEPLVVYFHGHVANRAAAQRALQVTSSPPVAGAWRWFGDSEVHYRPAGYWPAGTTVTITPALHGVQLAPGTWGVTQPSVTFHIGPAHISVVDVASHIMTVYADGQVVRVLKASTGRDKYPTRRGVHIVLSKQPDKLMDSATVGIPRTSPDGYYEHVAWDVRISDGGAFVHSAPWSVKDQGVRNVSHGCVNLAPADGQWFFNFSQLGDVVNVLNSPSPPLLTDPGTEDWNYTWSTWQSGNADTP